MAYMIQTGPDTFKYVSDEDEARQRQFAERGRLPEAPRPTPQQLQQRANYEQFQAERRPEGMPPPPTFNSYISPNAALKNEAADRYDLSPKASRVLMDTPTGISIGRAAPPAWFSRTDVGSGRAGGNYFSDGKHRDIPVPPITARGSTEYIPEVLTHELAHLWYDKMMPAPIKDEWKEQYQVLASKDALESGNYGDKPNEAYAHTTKGGPWEDNIPFEYRDRYYAGFYDAAPKNFEQPNWHSKVGGKPYAAVPDVLRPSYAPPLERYGTPPTSDVLRPHYSEPWWVVDKDGTRG